MGQVKPLFVAAEVGDGTRVVAGNAARKNVGTTAGTVAAGDHTHAAGSGDVVGPSSSVASELALFDGTTGKLIKRASATGIAKLAAGVLSAVTTWAGTGLTGTASRLAAFDGSGNPTAVAVGTGSGDVAAGDAPAAAVSTHVGLSDPHTQYALESALGNASAATIAPPRGELAGTVVDASDPRLYGPEWGNYRTSAVHSLLGGSAAPVYLCANNPRGAASDVSDGTGAWTNYATSGSANDKAGWWICGSSATANLTTRQLAPQARIVMKTPADITNIRFVIGWMSAESPASDNPASLHEAIVSYSTTAADGGWVLVNKDGTTQSTRTALGNIAASTQYTFDLSLSAAGVLSVSMNGAAPVTLATNPPGASTGLSFIAQVSDPTASARSIVLLQFAHRSL